MPKAPPRFRILTEETVTRRGADSSEEVNPYWLEEEPDPHPDPSIGCIRRGVCCKTSPGWFGPGEVETAAQARKMSPDEFVRSYLVIDSTVIDGEHVHVFAPVKMGRDNVPAIPPATRVDALYHALRGTCIFYTGEGCGIYETRPVECVHYDCTHDAEKNLSHEAIGRMWLEMSKQENS